MTLTAKERGGGGGEEGEEGKQAPRMRSDSQKPIAQCFLEFEVADPKPNGLKTTTTPTATLIPPPPTPSTEEVAHIVTSHLSRSLLLCHVFGSLPLSNVRPPGGSILVSLERPSTLFSWFTANPLASPRFPLLSMTPSPLGIFFVRVFLQRDCIF